MESSSAVSEPSPAVSNGEKEEMRISADNSSSVPDSITTTVKNQFRLGVPVNNNNMQGETAVFQDSSTSDKGSQSDFPATEEILTRLPSREERNNTIISCQDSLTMNDGSIVGLPTSSDEEDSTDELTRAGDALCRTLLKEQVEKEKRAEENHSTNLNQSSEFPKDHHQQLNLDTFETRSTTSPSTSEADTASGNPQELTLEERVAELEAKLATVSRILQQQQRLSVRSLLARSPTGSQRHLGQQPPPQGFLGMPLLENTQQFNGHDYHSQSRADSPPIMEERTSQKGMVPYLESAAPMHESPPRQRSMHQRKRLSFHLLYDGNEENIGLADDETNNNAANNNMKNSTFEIKKTSDDADLQRHPNEDHESANNNDINNRDEPQSASDSQESIHPLKKNDSKDKEIEKKVDHSGNAEKESPVEEEMLPFQPQKLSEVAACVVDAQMKSEEERKGKSATTISMDSSHASSTRTSSQTTKQLDGSQKSSHAQPIPRSSVSSTKEGEPKSALSSPGKKAKSPTVRARAVLLPELPPLDVSKDTRSKWLDHLNSFQESNHDVDRQMQEFIKVPGAVEMTLFSGLLICVDSFLYVLTILPIRFAWSCILLSLHYFFKWTKKPPGKLQFHRRHSYQLIQASILFFIYRYILLPISIGKLYHWIRGQAMLKLYVLIAMVEIFDRLMSSLGQDCLDSLYWNTTRRPRSTRMIISVSVVMVYTAVHSLILLLHVATLNVAMNSADEALLALLIGGNFAEIKSTVFKKYNKASLFKIVASDMCERFKLALFLGLVLLLNFCQGMDSRKMSDYQRISGFVWMSELMCDWLKHAFITKFNFIPSNVYLEYGLLLAGDVTGIGHEGVNLDHSHAVVKRIGFAQMPLVCVMARLVREAVKYLSMRIDSEAVQPLYLVLAASGSWILLLVFKLWLGTYLQRTSLEKLHAAPELSQAPLKPKQKQQ